MNAERVLAVVNLLRSELVRTRPYDELDALMNTLTQGSAEAAGVKERLNRLLSNAESNFLVPSARAIVRGIGANNLVGAGLAARLNALLDDYRLTPQEQITVIGQMSGEVLQFEGVLNNFVQTAAKLGIRPWYLPNGQCEVGILYPDVGVISNVESLSKESDDLNAALRVFMEIGGELGSPQIRELSSSGVQLFLAVSTAVGAIVVRAIDKVLDIVKKKYEIDKLRLEIEKLQLDIDAARQLSDKREAVEDQGKREPATEIIGAYAGAYAGRRNELLIALRSALTFIVVQAERGVVFEVSASNRTSDGKTLEEASSSQDTAAIEATSLALVHRLGAAMNELAARRDQLLLDSAVQDVAGSRGS
jgi:hypothetical protein